METLRSANGIVYFEDVDGKEVKFRLDFNAVADLEALLGTGIATLTNDENVGFNVIRAFYWAGLRFNKKGLTVDKAGKFIQKQMNSGVGLEELMEPVTEALIASGIVKRSDAEDAEEEAEEDYDNLEEGEAKN